jgi:hypothetical protein
VEKIKRIVIDLKGPSWDLLFPGTLRFLYNVFSQKRCKLILAGIQLRTPKMLYVGINALNIDCE